MRLFALLLLAAFLSFSLTACGEKSSPEADPVEKTDGTPAEGDAPADKPTDVTPTPTAARLEGGAESPAALVEQMRVLAKTEDFGDLVPLVVPEQRAVLTFALGMMGPAMMIGMGEAMLPMAGAGDPAKAAEAKTKLETLKAGFEALLKKHNIKGDMQGLMGQAQSLQGDPKAAIKALNEAFGHVDHAAFLRDSDTFMNSMKDKEDDEGGVKTSSNFPAEFEEIKIDGDKATVMAKGKDSPLGLVKKNGRWFIDFMSMMGK